MDNLDLSRLLMEYLQKHARGRENAVNRDTVLDYLRVGSIAIGLFGIYTCVQVERSSYGAAVALAAIACGWALIIDIRNFDLIRRVK
jgi:uncharacterized membrane protein